MTQIQYLPFDNRFNVIHTLKTGSGITQAVRRVTEFDLRAIGDGDVNEVMHHAILNPAQPHALPAIKVSRGARGHFQGFTL